MQCTVYWGTGGFLLAPDCVLASMEAEAAHGPLSVCGRLETAALPPSVQAEVDLALSDHLYAIVSPDFALRLEYEPLAQLPLPAGFHWEESDFWEPASQIRLVREVVPAIVASIDQDVGGWRITTGVDSPELTRGVRICQTRTGAMQFLTGWLSTKVRGQGGASDAGRTPVEGRVPT